MEITATEARSRFGQVLEQRQPVLIEKAGRCHSVLILRKCYQQMPKAEAGELLVQRKKRFNANHKVWLQALNDHFDSNGLWNDELRIW